jgi:hypothetical protein
MESSFRNCYSYVSKILMFLILNFRKVYIVPKTLQDHKKKLSFLHRVAKFGGTLTEFGERIEFRYRVCLQRSLIQVT